EGEILETPIYRLVDEPQTGRKYIITTSGVAAESAYALSVMENCHLNSIAYTVQIMQGELDGISYIDSYDEKAVWLWDNDNILMNVWSNWFLYIDEDSDSIGTNPILKSSWIINGDYYYVQNGSTKVYLWCNNGTWETRSGKKSRVYFYEEYSTGSSPIYARLSGQTVFNLSSDDDVEAAIRNGITVQTSTSPDGSTDLQTVTDYSLVTTDGTVYTVKYEGIELGTVTVNISAPASTNHCIHDSYTLDYGLPVLFDLTGNDEFDGTAVLAGVSTAFESAEEYVGSTNCTVTLAEGFLSSIETDDCDLSVSGGKLLYTLKTMSFASARTYYYAVECGGKYWYGSFSASPAGTMYFEDGFADYSDDSAGAESGTWEIKGDDSASLMQTATRSESADVFGHDSAYASSTGYSGGSAHYVTVSADNNPNPKYSGQDGHSWPKAVFTFTGSGFDLISLCDGNSGLVNVKVYTCTGEETSLIKNWIVDTFHGYSMTKTDGYAKYKWVFGNDGKWHRISSETVTDGVMPENGAFPENPSAGDVAYTYSDNIERELYSGAMTIYQAPVLRSGELKYGTYTVVVTPMYAAVFDNAGNGSYGFCLDAIRIYDPAGGTVDYTAAGEANARCSVIRDMLIEAEDLSANGAYENAAVYIDGFTGIETVDDYRKYGPKSETYLLQGQGIAFGLSDMGAGDRLLLGMRCISGSGQIKISLLQEGTVKYNITFDLSTATDMYYDVTPDAGQITSGCVVVIDCVSGIMSLTRLKYVPASGTDPDAASSIIYTTLASVMYAEKYVENGYAVPGTFAENEKEETVRPDYAALLESVMRSTEIRMNAIRRALVSTAVYGFTHGGFIGYLCGPANVKR
ncbi:MAG: hypothetical protein J5563_04225, partial [Clostridia bacterium]|nr:hypothetical protein [Clostridia bacterium]